MRIAIQRSVALLLAPSLFMGCYSYSNISPEAITPGMEVRARISAPTADRIGPSLGMSDARTLSGKVIDHQANGTTTLEVSSAPAGTIGAEHGLVQQVTINPGEMLELESRTIDRTKTGIVVGVAAAVTFASLIAVIHGHSTGADVPLSTTGPNSFKLGLLHLHF